MAGASERILNAFNATQDKDSWIATLLTRLPKLVTTSPVVQATSADYNTEWHQEFHKVVNERENSSVSSSAIVEVFQYEKYPYLTVDATHAPIQAALNIAHGQFLQLLENLEKSSSSSSNDDDPLVLVSTASGLILNVDEKLIGLVSRSKHFDERHPPYVYAVDGGNQGPLYFSFYISKSTLRSLLEQKPSQASLVLFEVNFFTSKISNARLELGGNQAGSSFSGTGGGGGGGKTYSEELAEGRAIDQIWNLKKNDSCITQISEVCEPTLSTTRKGETELSYNVNGKFSVSLNCQDNAEERITLLILPRLRNSIGSELRYSPALVSAFSLRDRSLCRVSKFYPIHALNTSKEQTSSQGPKGTLCFCFVGKNVNANLRVSLLEDDNQPFSFVNAKPGLNGFVAHFLGTPIYREMLHYLRQRRLVEARVEEDLKFVTADIIQEHEMDERDSMISLYVLKALLYCSYIAPKRLEATSDFEPSDFSRKLVDALLKRKGFVTANEIAANGCFEYSEEDDKFVLASVLKARQREAERGALSFLQVLEKSRTENARFEGLITSRLTGGEEARKENGTTEKVFCKRLKLDI